MGLYLLESSLEALRDHLRRLIEEMSLFVGLVATIVGTFGFESGRYCDGNTAQYLSCTRPATYYYFDWLHIALIVFGVISIALWLLKRRG